MNTVLLINPDSASKYCHTIDGWADRGVVRFVRTRWHPRFHLSSTRRCTTVPPMTLLALEALLKGRCNVTRVDEQIEPIDFSLRPDLVCITATTPQINRAREISGAFRAKGVRTAIGGIHATCLPEDCAADFDAVCVGEAEAYIDAMMDDLAAGRLKPVYRATSPVDIDSTPFYEYDVAAGQHLPFYAVNFNRGCAFTCEFCSIQSTQGRLRTRSVDSVVRAIERSGCRWVYFADAALTANRARARELLRALVPLRIKWLSCVTVDVAQDEELVDLMAQSGCWLASVGFETLADENLRSAGKRQNRVDSYRRAIRAFHQRHIAIESNFVFGFDADTEEVFERTARFNVETGIELPEFYILTPYPGTPLYDRLVREGRIVDRDWSHYDNAHFRHLPVYEPTRMSRKALLDGARQAERIAYGRWQTVRRLANSGFVSPPMILLNYLLVRGMHAGHGA